MTKLETLIDLNYLEKQNRKNRLEDKLKQQEYYGEIEELFDPLTKTLNANNETWLAHNEQTLRAIDWQNQELDKQTKMIEQAGFQIGEAASQMGETASRIQEAGSQISENTSKINETLKGTIEETQEIAPVFVDTKIAKNLHKMGTQTNPKLKLNLVDLPTRRYKMNGVDITLEQGAFLVRDNIYEFSEGFIEFLTNPNVTYNDDIEEDENKMKRFLKDIRYDLGKGDKKSARYRTIKRIIEVRDDIFGRGLDTNQQSCHHYVDQGTCFADPNNLVERLELLILETKAGHDGLYDEMLDISKQLLSMSIINQEQLDDFVFNCGK